MVVVRCRISVRMLAWLGSRCGTSTKAMPQAGGRWRKNCTKASRPPAEAPMPTMGNPAPRGFSTGATKVTGAARDWGWVLFRTFLVVMGPSPAADCCSCPQILPDRRPRDFRLQASRSMYNYVNGYVG